MKEEDSLTGTFLSSLVKEYHECKRKETNSVIRKNAKRKIQQAIKISGTKSSSHIAFQGDTPESFKTRIDAANSLGRLTTYSAEKKTSLVHCCGRLSTDISNRDFQVLKEYSDCCTCSPHFVWQRGSATSFLEI